MRRFYRNPDHIASQIPEAEKLAFVQQNIASQGGLEGIYPEETYAPILQEMGVSYEEFLALAEQETIPIFVNTLNRRINEVAAKVEQLAKEFAIEQAQEQYGVDISGEL